MATVNARAAVVLPHGSKTIASAMRKFLISDDPDDERTTFVDVTETLEREWSGKTLAVEWLGDWHFLNDRPLLDYVPELRDMDEETRAAHLRAKGWTVEKRKWRSIYGTGTLNEWMQRVVPDLTIVERDGRWGYWKNVEGRIDFWVLIGVVGTTMEIDEAIDDETIKIAIVDGEWREGRDQVLKALRSNRTVDVAIVDLSVLPP